MLHSHHQSVYSFEAINKLEFKYHREFMSLNIHTETTETETVDLHLVQFTSNLETLLIARSFTSSSHEV